MIIKPKLDKKTIRFTWSDLPRKKKKLAKKLLQRVINTNYTEIDGGKRGGYQIVMLKVKP